MSDEKLQMSLSSVFNIEIFIPLHVFREADDVLFDTYTKGLLSGASLYQK